MYLEHTGIVPDSCMPYVSGNGVAPSCPKYCNGTNIDINTQKYKAKTWYEGKYIFSTTPISDQQMGWVYKNSHKRTTMTTYNVLIVLVVVNGIPLMINV